MTNDSNEKMYSEMLEYAMSISPAAKVRWNEYCDRWEIYIPTEFTKSYRLPESYKGTPAWDAYQSYDATHGEELSQWAYKKNVGSTMEEIADRYNVQYKFCEIRERVLNELNASQGIPYSPIPLIEFRGSENLAAAEKEADEQCEADFAALAEKWE